MYLLNFLDYVPNCEELRIERLKSLRRQTIVVGGIKCSVVSTPDEEQSRILELLKVKL